MNFFRIGFGKPLDKVAKFMAILDLVLAFLVCVLATIEIYKIRIEAAEIHGAHDISNLTTYEAVRHHAEEIAERKMPTGGILSLVGSFIVVALEVYLCRLLYGGAKHVSGI
ncbi:unnamed protein product [Orchesella dallaii]|uniref:Uncharacterized protein n=1 Tax=Orchesella dallaii TaxID=48710 RepID=A0ABP1RQM9_9HEXA